MNFHSLKQHGGFMTAVIHFGMLVDINTILKEKKTGYSLHSFGGCSSCGVELRESNPTITIEQVIEIINNYLKDKWLFVEQNNTSMTLIVKSTLG